MNKRQRKKKLKNKCRCCACCSHLGGSSIDGGYSHVWCKELKWEGIEHHDELQEKIKCSKFKLILLRQDDE